MIIFRCFCFLCQEPFEGMNPYMMICDNCWSDYKQKQLDKPKVFSIGNYLKDQKPTDEYKTVLKTPSLHCGFCDQNFFDRWELIEHWKICTKKPKDQNNE